MAEEKDSYLERLYEIHSYSNTEFDKNILYIASGALALTVTFIEKVVPLRSVDTHWQTLLFIGWLLLTGSVVMYLLSHRCSKQGTAKVIREYKLMKEGKSSQAQMNVLRDGCNRQINRFNNVSSYLLVAGIVFILFFIYLNIV